VPYPNRKRLSFQIDIGVSLLLYNDFDCLYFSQLSSIVQMLFPPIPLGTLEVPNKK
jgi:hypothetical protein